MVGIYILVRLVGQQREALQIPPPALAGPFTFRSLRLRLRLRPSLALQSLFFTFTHNITDVFVGVGMEMKEGGRNRVSMQFFV